MCDCQDLCAHFRGRCETVAAMVRPRHGLMITLLRPGWATTSTALRMSQSGKRRVTIESGFRKPRSIKRIAWYTAKGVLPKPAAQEPSPKPASETPSIPPPVSRYSQHASIPKGPGFAETISHPVACPAQLPVRWTVHRAGGNENEVAATFFSCCPLTRNL